MNSAIELVTKKKKYSKFKCLSLILGNGDLKFEPASMFTGGLIDSSNVDSNITDNDNTNTTILDGFIPTAEVATTESTQTPLTALTRPTVYGDGNRDIDGNGNRDGDGYVSTSTPTNLPISPMFTSLQLRLNKEVNLN